MILFPEGRVSDVQRRMMTTPKEKNVHAVAVRGTFDDCQALVKGMFNDHAFRDRVALSGVNSINWARIVGAGDYYFSAAVALGAPDRPLSFAVPTGNFGDIFAGYVAKRMGLPIDKLDHRVERERYPAARRRNRRLRDARCRSDVVAIDGHSDLVEFRALSVRGVGPRCRPHPQFDGVSRATGRFELGRLWPRLQADFAAASASENDVAACIKATKERFGYVLDPHTACAVVAAERIGGNNETSFSHRPSRQVPRCHRGHHRKRPALPTGSPT